MGYINANGTKEASNAAGINQSYHKNNFYSKFPTLAKFLLETKSTVTNAMKGQTFEARYVYRHFNGSNYLSIYDNKGTWLGYVNESATKVVK